MGLDITINTDEPFVGRTQNDFIQYHQRAMPDSDSSFSDDSDDFGIFGDVEWLAKVLRPSARAVNIAMVIKIKCDSVLSKVLKPKMRLDDRTGECGACHGIDGFVSLFAEVELAAAAGCPSCSILVQGVKKYTPSKGALWRSKLGIMSSWNSGCAGRQFIRTNNRSANLPGALGVMALLHGEMDIKNIFTKTKDIESKVLMELNFFGVKGLNELPQVSLSSRILLSNLGRCR